MRSLLALASLVTVAGVSFAADPPAPTAKAYSLGIVRPPKDFIPVFGTSPATTVGIAILAPDRGIIGLDPKACKVTFTDDKGTDLATPNQPVIAFPTVFTDPKRGQGSFTIRSLVAPAAGATKVRVKGTLVVLCGTGEKTATADSLTIKAKEKATAGPAAFEVTEMGTQLFIRLTAEEPSVKSVMFLDGNQKLVGQLVPYITLGPKDKIIQNGMNTPPAKMEAVGIKVVHYEKVEAVKIEIDTEIGVGG